MQWPVLRKIFQVLVKVNIKYMTVFLLLLSLFIFLQEILANTDHPY